MNGNLWVKMYRSSFFKYFGLVFDSFLVKKSLKLETKSETSHPMLKHPTKRSNEISYNLSLHCKRDELALW